MPVVCVGPQIRSAIIPPATVPSSAVLSTVVPLLKAVTANSEATPDAWICERTLEGRYPGRSATRRRAYGLCEDGPSVRRCKPMLLRHPRCRSRRPPRTPEVACPSGRTTFSAPMIRILRIRRATRLSATTRSAIATTVTSRAATSTTTMSRATASTTTAATGAGVAGPEAETAVDRIGCPTVLDVLDVLDVLGVLGVLSNRVSGGVSRGPLRWCSSGWRWPSGQLCSSSGAPSPPPPRCRSSWAREEARGRHRTSRMTRKPPSAPRRTPV